MMKWIAQIWLFWGLLVTSAASGAEAKAPKPARTDDLFSEPKVHVLKIEIPTASLDALKKNPRTYVKGTVREGDKVYADAGIRLKGSAAFQEAKPSLTVKFNEFTSGLHFHGHSKIFLDNAHLDPAGLSGVMGGEIFRAAGVPAAKIAFARVELNGHDAGFYIVEQAMNREFISEYFKKTKGNLYEGDHSDITDKLEKDSGDSAEDQSDLKKLSTAALVTDPAARLKKLAAVLDLDRFIAFTALEVLTGHDGGYSMGRNNYRIYHDPATEQMVFIPHSLDHLFSKTDSPLLPKWKGLLAKAVLDNPEGQRRYRERMATLLGTACKVETLQGRVDELAVKIRPAFAQDAAAAKTFEAALKTFRERMTERLHFMDEELKKPAK